MKLSADAQRDCRRLDSEIPATEIEEKRAIHTKDMVVVQERLLHLRHSFTGLKC